MHYVVVQTLAIREVRISLRTMTLIWRTSQHQCGGRWFQTCRTLPSLSLIIWDHLGVFLTKGPSFRGLDRGRQLSRTRGLPLPLGRGVCETKSKKDAPETENPLFIGFPALRGVLRPWSRKGPDHGVGVDPSLLKLGSQCLARRGLRNAGATSPMEKPQEILRGCLRGAARFTREGRHNRVPMYPLVLTLS